MQAMWRFVLNSFVESLGLMFRSAEKPVKIFLSTVGFAGTITLDWSQVIVKPTAVLAVILGVCLKVF